VSTSASAQAARIGRSQRGGPEGGAVSLGERGVSSSPPSRPAPATASAAPAGSESELKSAVASANASQPASMLVAQYLLPARRA
jgi:hypothetical protein